ncbi:type II toxin-antitoxin system RatA family toxin [Streptomyces tagetis]|uniref:SRPBCC family protein n=1 Tax=Streptomyces tagetis TaxID=2820809 RepID=A0A940XDL0_9ACTN|nr:SRPBCC family protein [Streptomyces sp. RG38]MBQ0826564.1 SRPBCC family protein [Streptomyces sp. RG38]
MPRVTLDAILPGTTDTGAVFTRLADFAAYPKYTDAVREVTLTGIEDGQVASHWSVNFRSGVLCWSEHDRIDPVALTIDFTQVEGDFDRFDGSWRVTAAETGTRVRFTAAFDLGMPSLAAIIDPIACQALAESIGLILRGLFGEHITVAEPVTAAQGG